MTNAKAENNNNKKYIIANWKMYLSNTDDIKDLLNTFDAAKKQSKKAKKNNQVIICPSIIHIDLVKQYLSNIKSDILVGSQDCSKHESGAFTGETSALAIKNMGIAYSIIGHSERRKYHGETDSDVATKLCQLLEKQITPIICCGEDYQTYKSGKTKDYIESQLSEIFAGIENYDYNKGHKDRKEIIIAYEPIWAIGSGKTPTATEVSQIHSYIQSFIKDKFRLDAKVIYGGSVDKNNFAQFLDKDNIDGILVGGASTKKEDFSAMIGF